MRITEPIKSPSSKELFILRFMILAGLAAMAYLLYNLLRISIIDNAILYWLLIMALAFTCLKILHEWYHYFYISVPAAPPSTREYTVDIFTTYCAGEPYEMMLETLTAIQAIKYPHTTYLCDEADDPYLKNLCKELGIIHVTRSLKINAKAGNINNALQYAKGEICLILDPDHVPFPNFLDPIIPHFNNPEVGFVQVVQAYKNFHEGLIAKGAAQQTFQFYGPMMMTMNRYGTVLAIGANCTFRRAALDSIGGHAPGLAEDMHTAMQLHAKGWKSVYVPEVLARGLVPSTISAYYSQQLKWSRGVFELLVTSYPKLFRKFTWRQKLHYGIIPFYYLSGLIVLINFLIPILSLFFEVNPIKMDFETFALIALPMFIQTILVRNYVQRWVMEDEERGFHIVGGLLMIGTWWIFIVGLIYTIIRKKVPYVPTPKDSNEENNWPLNIPNIIVLLVSVVAIVYGLTTGWNPYTFVMAGLASINCLIILFNIVASRQVTFRRFKEKNNLVNVSARYAFFARKSFREYRVKAYSGIRSAALFLTLVTISTTVFMIRSRDASTSETEVAGKKKELFLSGIFAPKAADGLSSMSLINSYDTHFDIVSLYLSWGDQQRNTLPLPLIDSIYNAGSVPMITWEPWQNLFKQNSGTADKEVFKHILKGDYDQYIDKFALQIRELDRPVYLRFAHEADNPFYPWSKTGENTPEEFKEAWKYVHEMFSRNGAHNVSWVWNPWKADAVTAYFPGNQYVDWIGITNLNYGKYNPDKKWYSMEQLYEPFHRQPLLRSGIPVMLAEMGSLSSEGGQKEWFEAAAKASKTKFKEIKAFVLFDSGLDKNVPAETGVKNFDWRVGDLKVINISEISASEIKPVRPLGGKITQAGSSKAALRLAAGFDTVRGVNYSKGLDWTINYHILRHKDIIKDFKEIKSTGFNTIKRFGPDVFDSNILLTAKDEGLKINYAFFIPEDINYLTDISELEDLEKTILSTIKKYKKDPSIIAWNLGNSPLQNFEHFYADPDRIYQQYAYTKWLRNLVASIKKIDPIRPVSVEAELTERFSETCHFLITQVPSIDIIGVIVTDRSPLNADLNSLQIPYFLTKVSAGNFLKRANSNEGFFIADWQDQERKNVVTFDGLKDNWGRTKVSMYLLKNRLTNGNYHNQVPKVKILRPAATIYENGNYRFHALLDINNQWKLAEEVKSDLRYDWYLIKTDGFGNGLSMKFISSGPSISVKAPKNHEHYQLYLNASKGWDVSTARSYLNIPLIQK